MAVLSGSTFIGLYINAIHLGNATSFVKISRKELGGTWYILRNYFSGVDNGNYCGLRDLRKRFDEKDERSAFLQSINNCFSFTKFYFICGNILFYVLSQNELNVKEPTTTPIGEEG